MSISMKETAITTGSAVSLFMPLWLSWLPAVWQLLVSVLAGLILGLTAYNKILEIRLKRKELKDMEQHE